MSQNAKWAAWQQLVKQTGVFVTGRPVEVDAIIEFTPINDLTDDVASNEKFIDDGKVEVKIEGEITEPLVVDNVVVSTDDGDIIVDDVKVEPEVKSTPKKKGKSAE